MPVQTLGFAGEDHPLFQHDIAVPAQHWLLLAPLFQRLPKKLILTAAGEVLIGHIRQTLKELSRAQGKIEELKGLRRGEITVAMISVIDNNLVPGTVKQFRLANPRVKLILTLYTTGDEIQSAVANGEADLGIGFDFTKDSNLKVLARAVGKLGAVMAPSHPLAKRVSIRLSDCMDYPLVVDDNSSAIRPYLDAAFTRVSLDPQPIFETNAIEIMRHAGRLAYDAVRELSQYNQALMLIGHERGTSAISSVLAEMLKTMMREAAS
jgi:DNA-binding transcriptional LysR family regulator